MILGKYSMGIGDRFGRQGRAQLAAVQKARERGVEIVPVWNKSHREHSIVGTSPADVRREADEAVEAGGWTEPYFVDADHVGLGNVDLFLEASDFFTLDVDAAVVAIVNDPNPLIGRTTPELKRTDWGGIIVDEETCATSMSGVYAGGDIVTGAATVIEAMGAARRAARAMNKHLTKRT